MIMQWVGADWGELAMVLLSGVTTYIAILLYTRIAGLRSFSKMSASDFAMTVAVGSLFASTISSAKPSLLIGLFALAVLFTGQWLLALGRRKSDIFSKLVDNEPLLLMHGETILEENLTRANVTLGDLYGKLREANALNFQEVLAVVFETTGDISVLHSREPDSKIEPKFLSNVVDANRINRQRMIS